MLERYYLCFIRQKKNLIKINYCCIQFIFFYCFSPSPSRVTQTVEAKAMCLALEGYDHVSRLQYPLLHILEIHYST